MLLNPLRIFDSTFHSFNVNVISSTDPISKRRIYSLDQNLLVVFDLARRNGNFGKRSFSLLYILLFYHYLYRMDNASVV